MRTVLRESHAAAQLGDTFIYNVFQSILPEKQRFFSNLAMNHDSSRAVSETDDNFIIFHLVAGRSILLQGGKFLEGVCAGDLFC